jgi:hypothetical protein
MKFVFFFAAIYMSGPNADNPVGLKTQADCDKALKGATAWVEKHNAEKADKVLSYAMSCVELKPAKPGMQM